MASMGPQLYRCGNPHAPGLGHRAGRPCFNGAATLSLRKFVHDFGPRVDQVGASMGPQLYRCGNLPTTRQLWFPVLSFNGAATLSLRKFCGSPSLTTSTAKLQWGRNFIVAEINRVTPNLSFSLLLQWGRNFIVAEMHRTVLVAISRTPPCFNGAATLSLRK